MAVIGNGKANALRTTDGEVIGGTGGDDRLNGGGGADMIDGGAGGDRLSGGSGGDVITGGSGNDIIYGFNGHDIDADSATIEATRVGTGFSGSLFAASAPGDPSRLFVVEQHEARIRILDPRTGAVNATAFLDLPNTAVAAGGEQGLLGLAFDPGYETNGRFFVFLTNPSGDIELRSYTRSTANPDVANAASGNVILTIPHGDHANHNGGWIAFGPDGMLYVAVGDGGGGGDLDNNAQNKNSLLGKMLRIDVSQDDFPADTLRDYAIPAGNPFAGAVAGADEIWALGLRNPWRNSFDRLTGDLYIGDVGQNEREEVNFQPGGVGGLNYGWHVKEGTGVFNDETPGNPDPDSPVLHDPIHEYFHTAAPDGGRAIVGGYVYRGPVPGLQGHYFFADTYTNQVWSFRVVDGKATDFMNRTAQIVPDTGALTTIVSFAEDGHGNLYVVSLGGGIYCLDPHIAAADGEDRLYGGSGNDRVYGGAGDDRLAGGAGADVLFGGQGDDILLGGRSRDLLHGDIGRDIYIFRSGDTGSSWSTDDIITDFVQGEDRIDLSGIDAVAGGGDDAFTFIGERRLSGEAGELAFRTFTNKTRVLADTDGDGSADIHLLLRGTVDLMLADFIL